MQQFFNILYMNAGEQRDCALFPFAFFRENIFGIRINSLYPPDILPVFYRNAVSKKERERYYITVFDICYEKLTDSNFKIYVGGIYPHGGKAV